MKESSTYFVVCFDNKTFKYSSGIITDCETFNPMEFAETLPKDKVLTDWKRLTVKEESEVLKYMKQG